MCFSSSLPGKAPSSRVPVTRLPVWWDDVYNNGERQSNFTQHARHGSHLSLQPLRHIWKEMRLKTTLTSCTERHEGGRVAPQMSIRRIFTLAGGLSKARNITVCFFVSLCFLFSFLSFFFVVALTVFFTLSLRKRIFILMDTQTHLQRPVQTAMYVMTLFRWTTQSCFGDWCKMPEIAPNASLSLVLLVAVLPFKC